MKLETVNSFEVNDIETQYVQYEVNHPYEIYPVAIPAVGPDHFVNDILGISQWILLISTAVSFVIYIGKVILAKVKKEEAEDSKKFIKRARMVFLIFLILFILFTVCFNLINRW